MKHGKRGILDGSLVSVQEVVVEGGVSATDERYEGDECEADVWWEGGDLSEKEVLKRETDEGEEDLLAGMERDTDGFES